MLAVPVLTQDAPEDTTEDDKRRLAIWSARTAIDAGFITLLNLLELQRVVQDGRVPDQNKELVKQKDVR